LLDTLSDVLCQTYPDFEVIVGDQNASWPSELQPEIDRIKQDARVRWLTFERPGVVAVRNECVRRSIGEIALFVDDDVCITDPEFIEKHVRNPQSAISGVAPGKDKAR
jgi:glycosyltransferase involved in cell wall biosynthesis